MKRLILLIGGLALLQACASTPPPPNEPYTYNGALSELHRQGNPSTRPTQPVYSQDQETPDRLVSRVCTSTPIFDTWGRFVRYHVECY